MIQYFYSHYYISICRNYLLNVKCRYYLFFIFVESDNIEHNEKAYYTVIIYSGTINFLQ